MCSSITTPIKCSSDLLVFRQCPESQNCCRCSGWPLCCSQSAQAFVGALAREQPSKLRADRQKGQGCSSGWQGAVVVPPEPLQSPFVQLHGWPSGASCCALRSPLPCPVSFLDAPPRA